MGSFCTIFVYPIDKKRLNPFGFVFPRPLSFDRVLPGRLRAPGTAGANCPVDVSPESLMLR